LATPTSLPLHLAPDAEMRELLDRDRPSSPCADHRDVQLPKQSLTGRAEWPHLAIKALGVHCAGRQPSRGARSQDRGVKADDLQPVEGDARVVAARDLTGDAALAERDRGDSVCSGDVE
jgi:hypothetical protein